jgi:hypothetical protein
MLKADPVFRILTIGEICCGNLRLRKKAGKNATDSGKIFHTKLIYSLMVKIMWVKTGLLKRWHKNWLYINTPKKGCFS